jgi:CO/xanthine dehydrogenase Mo-binding subunit
VPAAECTARQGVVYHTNSERKRSFAALTAEAAMQWAPIRPKLKSVDDFTLIGQPIQRLDLEDKITGKAIYGVDVELPDMLRAVIARPPTFSATLATMDDSAVRNAPGIEHVFKLSNGVAVVANSTFAAMRGRDALQCTWIPAQGPVVSNPDITAALRSHIQGEPHAIVRDEGEVQSNLQGQRVTTDYQVPYLAHACMEPMNCTVYIHDNQCEVWAPTQAPEGARRTASAISGLPLSQVRVHITQLGGGFGRRASQDFVAEAVELAKHLDRPVQVLWTRDDDLRNANYRGASAHRLQATLDPTTKLPTAWSHRIVSAQFENPVPGQASGPAILGASDQPYEFDNCRIDWCGVKLPIPTTIWRSVGYSSNTYASETFINELADTAGIDPLAYRLSLLEHQPRLKECLLRVQKNSAWGTENRHLGVACYNFAGTNVAQVAEVEGTGIQDFKVIKLWCVVNCGIAVNPDLVRAQIEGGMLDGLSTALYGGLHIKNNAIEQSNFHNYQLLRMNAAPDVEVDLIQSTAPPGGVGEAGLPATAPALVGALHSLTGRWQREMPLPSNDRPVHA